MTPRPTIPPIVADIATVVDGIAFHTQSLALNAAAEAARLPETRERLQAVAVATCALAQRSAEAARSLRALRHATATDEGPSAEQAHRTMSDVVDQVRQAAQTLRQLRQGTAVPAAPGAPHGAGTAPSPKGPTSRFSFDAAIAQLDQLGNQSAWLLDSGSVSGRSGSEIFF